METSASGHKVVTQGSGREHTHHVYHHLNHQVHLLTISHPGLAFAIG